MAIVLVPAPKDRTVASFSCASRSRLPSRRAFWQRPALRTRSPCRVSLHRPTHRSRHTHQRCQARALTAPNESDAKRLAQQLKAFWIKSAQAFANGSAHLLSNSAIQRPGTRLMPRRTDVGPCCVSVLRTVWIVRLENSRERREPWCSKFSMKRRGAKCPVEGS